MVSGVTFLSSDSRRTYVRILKMFLVGLVIVTMGGVSQAVYALYPAEALNVRYA